MAYGILHMGTQLAHERVGGSPPRHVVIRKGLGTMGKMKGKRFITLFFAMSASALEVAAQTPSLQERAPQKTPPWSLAAASGSAARQAWFLKGLAARRQDFTAFFPEAYGQGGKPDFLFAVQMIRNPFVRQVRVTIVELWGGRIQLGGFAARQHIQAGLPGFGTGALPGLRICNAGYAVMRGFASNRSYGIHLNWRISGRRNAGRGPVGMHSSPSKF